MVDHFSRRSFLAGATALLTPGALRAGAPERSLHPRQRPEGLNGPERIIRAAGLPGDVAFAVADAETGMGLEAVGGDRALPPASVAKALTALYALDVLGAEHRFATRVLAAGPVENGILKGDLVLAGGGDPILDTEAVARLAAKVKAAGIHEVQGAFKVYSGALPFVKSIDPGQPDHVGYSPAVSGIALNFNRVHFEWARAGSGYAVSMDAPAGEYRPAVAMAKMQVVRRSLPIYTYEAGERLDSWTVASGALGGGGSRWLPVRLPGLYAGDVFQTLMRSHGIALGRVEVVRDAPQGATELARHESEPLRDILRDMLKYSTNITAEMVGMSATAARAGIPASLAASAAEMNVWAMERFGMQAPAMVDHSGLGPASRLAPQDLVRALVAVHGDGTLRSLMKPFLMRDAAGRVMTTHPIKVDAKTGTLNFVSGLGGYMTAADGTHLAFAIFTADLDTRARIPRAQRERPDGARSWNRRAKGLQQALIERWGALYGS